VPNTAAPPAEITLVDGPDEAATARVVSDGLDAFNEAAAGPHGYRPLTLSVRRPGEGRPAGGLTGFSLYGWLFVKMFYLPEDLRRGRLGTALLRRAEEEARARGCVGIYLDTFSFQARPFYERQGYRVFGTIEDHPPGHARHFLMKRLEGGHAAGAGRTEHVPT
jgi:GNAT superfamily N-acetyltransferase